MMGSHSSPGHRDNATNGISRDAFGRAVTASIPTPWSGKTSTLTPMSRNTRRISSNGTPSIRVRTASYRQWMPGGLPCWLRRQQVATNAATKTSASPPDSHSPATRGSYSRERRPGMSDLQQTIEATTRRVKNLLARNGQVGEQDTKAVLIDPVLQVLGWDIHELDDVRREYRYGTQGNPVDYALFIGGKPTMFLEAKSLGASLRDQKWRSQVVNYANTAGVEWCVLTDGNLWHIYKSNAPGDLDRKLFLETWLHSAEGRTPPSPPPTFSGCCRRQSSPKTT